jgi:hypothetical protein
VWREISDDPTALPLRTARSFRVYGLRVRSDLPLPLAPIADDRPDVVIRFEGFISRLDCPPPGSQTKEWRWQENHWLLRFQADNGHVLEFLFAPDGKHITIRQSYPEWRDTLFILMYTALAAALHLQGVPLLHASSLVNNGAAFLFMGVSGSGKSTLAAALAAQGLSFQADDIAALSWESGRPVVQAGYPILKIQLPTGMALGWPTAMMRSIFLTAPEYPEKWVDGAALPGGFHDRPAPLKAIYILSGRRSDLHTPRIETLPPSQGCLALVKYLYGQPWLKTAEDKALRLCSQIAAVTPIRRLWLPDGLERLGATAQAVMTDMRSEYASGE